MKILPQILNLQILLAMVLVSGCEQPAAFKTSLSPAHKYLLEPDDGIRYTESDSDQISLPPASSARAIDGATPKPALAPTDALRPPVCSNQKMQAILEKGAGSVNINCQLTLSGNEVLTKALVLKGADASNITVNCNGATLDGRAADAAKYTIAIHSVRGAGDKWSVPQNIEIKNCKIFGAIRIYGMATNGQGEVLRESSYRAGHTERAQAAAPRNLSFNNLAITGSDTVPFYIGPGVHQVSLSNSRFDGKLGSVAVYLDAESSSNLIRNNLFLTEPKNYREVMAVDGSAYNTIVGNYFSGLNRGGIYLYRNCGEGGTVRHQAPRGNRIINNVFYYSKFEDELSGWQSAASSIYNLFGDFKLPDFPSQAIWVASRNGNGGYCGDDKGYAFGSSVDDRDNAKNSVLIDNRIIKLNVQRMMHFSEVPNITANNVTIAAGVSLGIEKTPTKRMSSCFVRNGFPSPYIAHGESVSFFRQPNTEIPKCNGTKLSCNDGVFTSSKTSCGQEKPYSNADVVTFQCLVRGTNGGCTLSTSCPAGTKVVAAKALCNLEYGTIAFDELTNAAWNTLQVKRSSDHVSDGLCKVGNVAIASLSQKLGSVVGSKQVRFSCREHDENGGDCHMIGRLLCR